MKCSPIVAIIMAAATLLPLSINRQSQAVQPPQGFAALFNGKDLDGWFGRGTDDPRKLLNMTPEQLEAHKKTTLADLQKHWSVQGDELVNDGQGLYMTTDKFYGDFELLVEYKTVAKADSGIYLRGVPQVQIWDTTQEGGNHGGNTNAELGSGGLWNNSAGAPGKNPMVLADKPFGEWNKFRIIMVGERVTVWFNDQLVVDYARMENYFDRNQPVPRAAPIQLQTHGGEIRWRNVFIREIESKEANKWLVEHDRKAGGYESIFNGKDFTGWAGPIENYEANDGILMCKPQKGGTIYTEKEYSDFKVSFQFKLPPGGNNGLALRYPGNGDTAYAGMCELQVLDNTSPKYAKLDPRQYHASVYGQVPATRGYLRPVGEWNYQTVTVKGQQITVELNGSRILDADTSKVTEFMYEADKFKGRNRTKGHFGFAGHSDPVEFREIQIKSLD